MATRKLEPRLFTSPDYPGQFIGTDAEGALVRWPDESHGWDRRTPHTGPERGLVACEVARARGTGWPSAGRAKRPRDPAGKVMASSIGVRCTPEERERWQKRAESVGKPLSVWAHDTLNAEDARAAGKRR